MDIIKSRILQRTPVTYQADGVASLYFTLLHFCISIVLWHPVASVLLYARTDPSIFLSSLAEVETPGSEKWKLHFQVFF